MGVIKAHFIFFILTIVQCSSPVKEIELIEPVHVHPVEKWQSLFKHAPDSLSRDQMTKQLAPTTVAPEDLLKTAQNALALGQLAYAEELFSRLGTQKDESSKIEALLGIAQIHLIRRKFEGGEFSLRQIQNFKIVSDSQRLRADYLKAMLEFNQGRLDQAQAIFEMMIINDPRFAPAYAGLVRIYLNQNLEDFAARVLTRGIDMCGHSAEFYHLRGTLELRQQKLDTAKHFFERAVKQVESYIPARLALAGLLADSHSWESAERMVQESLSIEPHHYQARVMLAVILSRQARYDEAKNLLEQAILFYPASAQARFELGMLMATHFKKNQRALQLFTEVESLPDADPSIVAKAKIYAASLRQ
jgi:tetratricopeptide (TPR) repeat protein